MRLGIKIHDKVILCQIGFRLSGAHPFQAGSEHAVHAMSVRSNGEVSVRVNKVLGNGIGAAHMPEVGMFSEKERNLNLILLRLKGTGGINEGSPGAEQGCSGIEDLRLQLCQGKNVVLRPDEPCIRVTMQHPGGGAGRIDQNLIENPCKGRKAAVGNQRVDIRKLQVADRIEAEPDSRQPVVAGANRPGFACKFRQYRSFAAR